MIFANRKQAAQQLLPLLQAYRQQANTIVLGLPRGGVVTAAEIARGLNVPLDIVTPRKIGAPFNKEFAVGAVTMDGAILLNDDSAVPDDYIKQAAAKQQREAQRRFKLYRGQRPPLQLHHKTIVLVDDGIATGLTMRAALHYIRSFKPKRIVLIAPVGAPDAVASLTHLVDQVVVPHTPDYFGSVGEWYAAFPEVTDDEVIALLQ
ncbi:MAG: phosphoribosyltransferase [Candidatus Kerfeldbacteria bacterium]|nr:phosphoribosyltransferase [Candidatus Kerfeldbacteria bacterium]